jgi:two-component system, OmpR family, sensor histidine kinase SenX3
MKNSQPITRIAFIVIIAFVVAQVVWWIVFTERYVSNYRDNTLQTWQKDADVANELVALSQSSMVIEKLQADYPHLQYDQTVNEFVIDKTVSSDFVKNQNGYIRMFAFEGPFFVLVVLTGLYIIARSLRTERELKRRQQNFLSAITHEFKTPMSTLRLLVETALFRPLSPEKQKSYLEKMSSELLRLEQTSEQVLAAARLEHSESAPILENLELNSVVQGVIGKARSGLEARGAILSVDYSPEPLNVSLDINAFSVVLNNLLDNAVKYSPNAPKVVKVRLERQNDLVLIHVDDEGIGIPEQELSHVFERFYRVGNEMTRESKGVGLGLHLVKTVTEAMNGWVRVEGNPNAEQGTRFTVVLPRRVVAEISPPLPRGAGGIKESA